MLFEILQLGCQKLIILLLNLKLSLDSEHHFGSFFELSLKYNNLLHILLLSLDYIYIGNTCLVFSITYSSTILKNYNLFFVSSSILESIYILSQRMIRSFSPIYIFRISICFCNLLFVIHISRIGYGRLFISWLRVKYQASL